jgi:hypothetical protein
MDAQAGANTPTATTEKQQRTYQLNGVGEEGDGRE